MPEAITLETLSAQLATQVSLITTLTDRLAALEAAKPAVVDITPLAARLDKIEAANTTSAESALEAEKLKIVPLFAAEGKNPINPATGKAYTAEELKALDLPVLKVLHANCPITVPITARTRTASTEGKSELKGLAKAIAANASKQ
jgi:hypothetical protein